jgi:hypothetical protein
MTDILCWVVVIRSRYVMYSLCVSVNESVRVMLMFKFWRGLYVSRWTGDPFC